MESPEVYPKIILDGRSFRAVWESPDVVVIRSKRYWWYILLLAVLLAHSIFALFILAVVITAEVQNGRLSFLGLACFGLFCTVFILAFAGFTLTILRAAFTRQTTIDIAQEVVRIQHIPGLGKQFYFESIREVVLLLYRDKSGGACHLCLARTQCRGLTWIMSAAGYRAPEFFRDELLPLAQLLAWLFDRPLSWSWQRFSPFSVQRWSESHPIPLVTPAEEQRASGNSS